MNSIWAFALMTMVAALAVATPNLVSNRGDDYTNPNSLLLIHESYALEMAIVYSAVLDWLKINTSHQGNIPMDDEDLLNLLPESYQQQDNWLAYVNSGGFVYVYTKDNPDIPLQVKERRLGALVHEITENPYAGYILNGSLINKSHVFSGISNLPEGKAVIGGYR